jgi:hypothetical protein
MAKFYQHYEMIFDSKTSENVKITRYFQQEGFPNMSFPKDDDNMDYSRMMEEVDAGTSTIEEVDDTP